MAKLITDYLDEYSRAIVGHEEWAYLDCLTKEKQLDVILNYQRKNKAKLKYVVVVFENNNYAKKHFERNEELGLNEED